MSCAYVYQYAATLGLPNREYPCKWSESYHPIPAGHEWVPS